MVVGKISSQMRLIGSDVKLTSPFTMSYWYLGISRNFWSLELQIKKMVHQTKKAQQNNPRHAMKRLRQKYSLGSSESAENE